MPLIDVTTPHLAPHDDPHPPRLAFSPPLSASWVYADTTETDQSYWTPENLWTSIRPFTSNLKDKTCANVCNLICLSFDPSRAPSLAFTAYNSVWSLKALVESGDNFRRGGFGGCMDVTASSRFWTGGIASVLKDCLPKFVCCDSPAWAKASAASRAFCRDVARCTADCLFAIENTLRNRCGDPKRALPNPVHKQLTDAATAFDAKVRQCNGTAPAPPTKATAVAAKPMGTPPLPKAAPAAAAKRRD